MIQQLLFGNDIRIENEGDFDTTKPVCIFGVLDNPLGNRIENYITKTLSQNYNIIKLYHNGLTFEYPAMRLAQYTSIKHNIPVLYLHTKGAYNWRKEQAFVIDLWMDEFTKNKDNYLEPLSIDKPVVTTPLSGNKAETWFNGFFANPQAWKDIPAMPKVDDRFYYEKLFEGKKYVKGVCLDRVSGPVACRYVINKFYKKHKLYPYMENRALQEKKIEEWKSTMMDIKKHIEALRGQKQEVIETAALRTMPSDVEMR